MPLSEEARSLLTLLAMGESEIAAGKVLSHEEVCAHFDALDQLKSIPSNT